MYYLFIMRQVICWFVYIEKNRRFTVFLDSNLHTRLAVAVVTENELGTFTKNFIQIRPRFI